MIEPVRLTLSRAKGYNLQAASFALNGLPAVKVDRTTPFGNPFIADLAAVAKALAEGRTVYAPLDGLGTGLARLPEHAPALHRLIVAFFRAAPGKPCPWIE